MPLRERILEALRPLVGEPLWGSGRAADMETFQFGARRARTNRRGERVQVGQWALHVQCAWQLAGPEGVVIAGSGDVYYPPGDDPYDEPPGFEWDSAGGNGRDERVAGFFAYHSDAPPVVEGVDADGWGGVILTLSRGHRLALLPSNSLPSERWRLFQPTNDEVQSPAEHFVVTGEGIEE